jgi:hypothetical protein
MKFFSNEAKENTDDRDRTDDDVNAVPQQRAGSPWGDAPRDGDVTDPDRRDATDEAFGDRPGDRPADADRPWSQSGDATDGPETAGTTTYGPDGTVLDQSADDRDGDLVDKDTADKDLADKDRVDESDAVKDEGTFDSPKAVEPATGEPLADKHDDVTDTRDDVTDRHDDAAAVPVESVVDAEPPATPDDDKAHAGDATPVVAAAAVPVAAASTGSASSGSASSGSTSGGSSSDRLFPDGDSFNERFRDIQLRFVDSPKEATAEAAALVSEAVDKLTSNLKSQRDSLTGGSDDTEKLRVELRAYRDLLNRLVNL